MDIQFTVLVISIMATVISGLCLFIANNFATSLRDSAKAFSDTRDKLAYRIEQVNVDVAVLTQRFDDWEKSNG